MIDPIADELERVLNFNGEPVTYQVPVNARFYPGTGECIYDGMVIAGWTED